MLNVHRPGSRIQSGNHLTVIVVEVLISSDDCIKYKCSWWDGTTRYEQWLHPEELEYVTEPYHIGFLPSENNHASSNSGRKSHATK